jgi:outer membrane protein assembly factor BamB
MARVTSLRAATRGALALLAFVIVLPGAAFWQRAAAQGADWTRFGWDAARTDAALGSVGITAQDLGRLVRQQVELGGTVDASPIYLHGVDVNGRAHDVFFVTTSYGRTLAIDAGDGAVLWRFTPPGYAGWVGGYRITTATPVADPSRRYLYAAAPDGVIRKLAVADGSVVWATAVTRLPSREKIASALNLFQGRVLVTTGGYIGDAPPYQGHLVVLDARTGHLLHVWNALCSDRSGLLVPSSCPQSGSAIWGRGGAVVDPASGHIFVATGNGRWNGRTDWGDATIELSSDGSELLGNYTPRNTAELDARDLDLGSTAPVLLGGGWLAQGGKDGTIRVLDWARMGGRTGHEGGEAQTVPTPSGRDLFTAPAVWRQGGRTWLFAADNGGTAAWTFSSGRLERVWSNDHAGTSPVLAGAMLYVYDPAGGGLRVYAPTTGRQLADLAAGRGHWNSPIVVDGRIALPEGNANAHQATGVLDIWRVGR